jgi:hypothetical protein
MKPLDARTVGGQVKPVDPHGVRRAHHCRHALPGEFAADEPSELAEHRTVLAVPR